MNESIEFIDSHTAGEPTRVIVSGGPDLGGGPLEERLDRLRGEHDWFRTALVAEPRGVDSMVGALLCEPVDPGCLCGVIFFNAEDYLGMCGHGTIGLMRTLQFLGRIGPGEYRIETPVGEVSAVLHENTCVSVVNVPSFRRVKDFTVEVPGLGAVTGDIAWGGNWFFLCDAPGIEVALENRRALTDAAIAIRRAVNAAGHPEVDHVELFQTFGPGLFADGAKVSQNFVLCPNHTYDRSPCGTGTSAKLACLAADGELAPGETYGQLGITGILFEGRYEFASTDVEGTRAGDSRPIIPTILGEAYVNARGTIIEDPEDYFGHGIAIDRGEDGEA